MYDLLLSIHNIARWLVLLAALYLLYCSLNGLVRHSYGAADRRASLVYIALLHTQLLLGILLMVLSPLVQNALANPGAAMQNDQTRFFLAEHWVLMLAALALAHVGSARSRGPAQAASSPDLVRLEHSADVTGHPLVAAPAAPWLSSCKSIEEAKASSIGRAYEVTS